ncbi:phospholipase A and acyltransferase 4-like [Myotis yumanensis]|uniref:phospholipase A and acyltransferase 4-like n=1 Tax=Myotis yumanensis TaxID=159337 RepID=UPI0038D4CF21
MKQRCPGQDTEEQGELRKLGSHTRASSELSPLTRKSVPVPQVGISEGGCTGAGGAEYEEEPGGHAQPGNRHVNTCGQRASPEFLTLVCLVPDEFPGAGSSSLFSVLSSRGMVKRELLSDVVGGCRYRVNNHLDHEYSPLPVNKIISSAEEMVGKELAYSVLSRNCEHFVTDLRYGKARSPQAEKFVTGASVTLGAAVVAALACSVMKKRSQHQ